MRVRLRFSKHGKVRFTSHRDVARMWERALRRASLPVAYSEGFSPRPKRTAATTRATTIPSPVKGPSNAAPRPICVKVRSLRAVGTMVVMRGG